MTSPRPCRRHCRLFRPSRSYTLNSHGTVRWSFRFLARLTDDGDAHLVAISPTESGTKCLSRACASADPLVVVGQLSSYFPGNSDFNQTQVSPWVPWPRRSGATQLRPTCGFFGMLWSLTGFPPPVSRTATGDSRTPGRKFSPFNAIFGRHNGAPSRPECARGRVPGRRAG